jgi:hypothetical protein
VLAFTGGVTLSACSSPKSHDVAQAVTPAPAGMDAGPMQPSPLLGGEAGAFGDDAGGGTGVDAAPVGPNICQSCTAAGGQCSNNSCSITENPGNVSATVQTQLQGTGTADPGFQWLYPYDKTVFPRGLQPPKMQLGGMSPPDATYVQVTFPSFQYQGYFGPSTPGSVQLSTAVWTAITESATATTPVQVQITKVSGGQVSGPITESWTIAQGNIKGTIYYETYGSTIIGGSGVGIMQIQPGASQPTVVKTGCGNVCHAASADGSTLVAAVQISSTSASYDLKNGAELIFGNQTPSFTYGGLYPDGSFLISATDYRAWAPIAPSGLFDTQTGASIAAPGWDGVIKRDGTPAFSPDGQHIAFNHEDTGQGHSLAVMDFSQPSHTFSNLTDIATDATSTLAWPAFTPDGKWVIYHAGSNAAFETDANASGDVFMVDLATHTVQRLNALDGYTGPGSGTYLPASDTGLSFAPTVLPEAVGGYFWVVFTSHRSYGNTLPSKENGDEDGKLWVAAIDRNPTAGQDASHPAFYLDGQEQISDNLRGFWVLNPCQQDGSGCQSGDECCGGYCLANGEGGAQTCGSVAQGCAQDLDKCTTASDCCDANAQCINGRCAAPAPQ